MKLKKKIPLIDQHDKLGFWGGKFGGSYIPETLKKPVDDLTKEFKKLRKNKKFLNKRDLYFKNYIGSPTRFIKLENLNFHEKYSNQMHHLRGNNWPHHKKNMLWKKEDYLFSVITEFKKNNEQEFLDFDKILKNSNNRLKFS